MLADSRLAGAGGMLAASAAPAACTTPVTQTRTRAGRPTGWSRRPKSCRATAIIAALRRRTSSSRHSRPASCAIASCCARRASTSAAIRSTRPSALLKQVSTYVADARISRCARRSPPRSHLQAQHPDRALAELDRIPQPLPREDVVRHAGAARAGAVRAESPGRRRHHGARTRARAEQPGRSARQSPADLAGPAAAAPRATRISLRRPARARPSTGWLDLGRAALVAARNPFTANEDLADWRGRYPSHPANSLLTEEVLPELGVGLDYPTQIALDPAAVGTAARRGHRGARRISRRVAAAGCEPAAGGERLRLRGDGRDDGVSARDCRRRAVHRRAADEG